MFKNTRALLILPIPPPHSVFPVAGDNRGRRSDGLHHGGAKALHLPAPPRAGLAGLLPACPHHPRHPLPASLAPGRPPTASPRQAPPRRRQRGGRAGPARRLQAPGVEDGDVRHGGRRLRRPPRRGAAARQGA